MVKALARKKRQPIVASTALAKEFNVKVPEGEADMLLSPNQIGKILNLTGEAVKQWIYLRRLPAVKLTNGYWKVKKSDLERYLQERSEARPTMLVFSECAQLLNGSGAVEGVRAFHATNLVDFMLKAADLVPYLVIADVSMPDAIEAIKRLRKDKKMRSMKVVFFSTTPKIDPNIQNAMLDLGGQAMLISQQEEEIRNEIRRVLLS